MDRQTLSKMFSYCERTGELTRMTGRHKGKVAGCKWTSKKRKTSYIILDIFGKQNRAHNVIWTMLHGNIPKPLQIDHIDGDGTNNRLDNLRLVTSKENNHNQPRRSNNTSGVMGVYYRKNRQVWGARIILNGASIFLGEYKDKFNAYCAKKSAENKYGFHPNHGRIAR